MTIRILLGIIGIVVAVLSMILLGFNRQSLVLQLCVAFGAATAFIAIGCEHFCRDSPVLDRFTSRRAKAIVGCVFVVVGVGVCALVIGNLLTRGAH